jgi:choline-sulfatase
VKAATHLYGYGGRMASSALGASLVGLAAAYIDASWARGGGEAGPRTLALFLADAGVLAPLFLVLGFLVGGAALLLSPDRVISPTALVSGLRLRAIGRPADVAAFVPLAVLAAFLWMTLVAHLARALLALELSTVLTGVAIAAGSVAIGMLAALTALSLMPPLRRALANASDGRPACVDPAVTLMVAVLIAGALFGLGVVTGGLSGEGGFLGIYGVFRRPELDLRAAGVVVAVAIGAVLVPNAIRRPWGPIALLIALAPLGLTARASAALTTEPAVAQAIERGAPTGKMSLRLLRKLADRDKDGASAAFGGGDCSEGNPRVGPNADEVPDNGVDEDCSGADLSAAAMARVASPAATVSPAARTGMPADMNLVLISIDTLRHDLGYAGNPRPLSPNIDALAARSTVFDRAYALASYTGKSVGPMLIGKYGSETHRNWGHFNKFGAEDTFLAERLKRAGVATVSVHAHRYFGDFGGLDRGFDVVDLSAAPPEGAKWDVDDKATSPALTDAAIARLRAPERASGRFFLWVHYLDPHADYLEHDDGPSFGKSQRDLYDGEVAFTDKHVGRLLDAIAASPFAARTAIILTSDHGEAFGEHKLFRHGFEVWEELVRVPLLVHAPGLAPSRVAARRSAVDLVPTALDLMGIPAPAGEQPDDFLSGLSLLPDMVAGAAPAPRDVLVDMPAGPYNDARRALIHGDLKLTVSNNTRFELYDLGRDPEERKDLWGDAEARRAIEDQYAATKTRLREIKVTGPRK